MYEPKYKLNKKDAARWHALLVRHCCEVGPPKPEFPPLTPEENAEFERLQRKRIRKVHSHPKVKESLERQRRHTRKLQRLLKKLKIQYPELNETKPTS